MIRLAAITLALCLCGCSAGNPQEIADKAGTTAMKVAEQHGGAPKQPMQE